MSGDERSVLTDAEWAARRFETASAAVALEEWGALWVEDPMDGQMVVMAPRSEAPNTLPKLIALCNRGLEILGTPLITAELVLLLDGAAKIWPAAAEQLRSYARALERLLPPSAAGDAAAPAVGAQEEPTSAAE